MSLTRFLSPALLTALLCSAAAAQSLAGRIVTTTGAPVPNAAIILSNGAPVGTTDVNGNFLISGLRNRVYTVQIDPHSNALLAQQFDFSVSGAATLGNRVLQPALPLSAQFVGPTGAGLLSVNMNAYLLDGTKLFTPHDGSDIAGNVTIAVPVNTPVRIRAVPPVGSTLVPFEEVMTIGAATNLGTKTLRQGYVVTGTAADKINSLPISGCEVITTNLLTGEIVVQLNKLTNAVGAFSLLLPFGLYEIDIIPPLGNLHHAKQLIGLPIITAGYTFGIIGLDRGFNFTGQVVGPSGPVAGADIDIYTADGYKLFTPNDNTTAAGVFAVVVPPGTYSVRVDPAVATGLVGVRTPSQYVVATNTSAGVISLLPGVTMNATITDFSGAPVPHANVNFFNPATGAPVNITGDIADANGELHGVVPLGTWNIEINAPQGSLAASVKWTNVPVIAPISTPVVLPRKNLMMNAKVLADGVILSIPNGGVMPIDWTFQNPDPVNHAVYLDAVGLLPSGQEVPWVPLIFLDLPATSGITLQFQMPMPVLPANQLDRLQRFVIRFRNPADLSIVEQAYVNYVPL